ncbi:MAG: hypothetical protein ABJE95_04630 [Byssovorax sp.]
MRSRDLLAAAGILFVAACGARSTLHDPSVNSPGSGGSGTGSATATSGTGVITGPGGGPSALCTTLVGLDPPLELVGIDSPTSAHDPALLQLAQGDVLALARHQAPNAPAVGSVNLIASRFDAWGTWLPDSVFASEVTASAPDFPFVSSAEPKGTFALGMKPFPQGGPIDCQLQATYGISPDAPSSPGALTAHSNGTCDDYPISVATAQDGTHLVASDLSLGNETGVELRAMTIEVLDPTGELIISSIESCATKRLVGDALPTTDGFLFVQSAADSLDCFNPTSPRALFLRHFHGTIEDDFDVHDGFDDLVYTRILPRAGGSWILYRESGASAEVQPPAIAVPFGTDSVAGSEFPVTNPGAGQVAAAAFGGGFAVASVDSIDPSGATVLLRVYSPQGTLTAQTSFSTNGAWLGADRLAILASPDSSKLLVGWTGGDSGASARMMVRRFDCANVK